MSEKVDTVVLKKFQLAPCVSVQLVQKTEVCVRACVLAERAHDYLGNIASLFIRRATLSEVIESISSGWSGCVDILHYLPVALAHVGARPSFTHENATRGVARKILISELERPGANGATVRRPQGRGETWGQRNKAQNRTEGNMRRKLPPFPPPSLFLSGRSSLSACTSS